MGFDAWLTLGVTASVLLGLAATRIAPDVILWAGLTVLLTAGVLTPVEAIAGLANEGLATVGILFVVTAGLRETGGIHWLAERMLGRSRSVLVAQIRIMGPVAVLSAFLNNTPIVAMLLPGIRDWARKQGMAASKLFIPMSYAAILGGRCTLIGTSTNLVINGLWVAWAQRAGIGMFEMAAVAVPCTLVGMVYVIGCGRWLLPDRRPAITEQDDPREYTVEMLVEPGSALVGKTIEEAGLRHLPGMYLMEIDRDSQVLAAVSALEVLQPNDRLVFVGVVESVVDLQKIRGLKPATDQVFKLKGPRFKRCLVEMVVSNSCPLAGKTVRDGRFRSVYNAVVIAVGRNGERIHRKIGDIVLQAGDTLLVETFPWTLQNIRNSRDFFLVSHIEDSAPLHHERIWLAFVILGGMITAVATGWLSMLNAGMLAAGLMIITRCCTARAARASVDWQILLVIAAALGLGKAMEVSGTAAQIAEWLVGLAGGTPWVLLAGVYVVTVVFSEIITNNAAAVLVFPIAMAAAQGAGLAPMPFVMALMMGASASFATPIGYQTNLMVYGPGGYRFSDYLKIGIPLNILLGILALVLIPFIWPLD